MLSLNPEVDVREMQALFLLSHALTLLSYHECLNNICLIYDFFFFFTFAEKRTNKKINFCLCQQQLLYEAGRFPFVLFVLPDVS